MRVTSVVLDLDDTLYLERDFVRSGIAAVGAWFAERTARPGFAEVATRLWDVGHRGTLFDETLRAMEWAVDPGMIDALIEVYREHEPSIALAEDAAAFLADPGDRRLALVTDGIASTQRRKIAALNLERFALAPMIATAELGGGFHKPHRRAFDEVAALHGAPPEAIVYVADNPAKDFVAPRALGWRTVQINRPAAIHPRLPPDPAHAAEVYIESFAELDAALARLTDARH